MNAGTEHVYFCAAVRLCRPAVLLFRFKVLYILSNPQMLFSSSYISRSFSRHRDLGGHFSLALK